MDQFLAIREGAAALDRVSFDAIMLASGGHAGHPRAPHDAGHTP